MKAALELPASLVRYRQASQELSDLYRERGDLTGDITRAKVDAYHQSLADGLNVTTARHNADVAALQWTIEGHRIDGEADALLIELRYLDHLIAWENHA